MRSRDTPLGTVAARQSGTRRSTHRRTGSDTHAVRRARPAWARRAASAPAPSTRTRCLLCSSMRGALTSSTPGTPAARATSASAVENRE